MHRSQGSDSSRPGLALGWWGGMVGVRSCLLGFVRVGCMACRCRLQRLLLNRYHLHRLPVVVFSLGAEWVRGLLVQLGCMAKAQVALVPRAEELAAFAGLDWDLEQQLEQLGQPEQQSKLEVEEEESQYPACPVSDSDRASVHSDMLGPSQQHSQAAEPPN